MIEQYRNVYGMLEDEISRDIYLHRLNYMVSGDYRHIREIVTRYLPKLSPLTGETIEDLRASMPQDRKVVLYGAGAFGKEMLACWEQDKRFLGFCSHTRKKQEEGYLGYPCISPEELLQRRDLSVVISALWARDEIMQVLRDGNYPEELIFHTKGLFVEDSPGQYFDPEFMTYGEEEVLVDAGCFNLNSALKLREYCGHVKKVYAFEPDPENYAVCLEKRARTGFSEVELLPLGTWSRRTTLHFHAAGMGCSGIRESGGTSIQVAPIDEIVDPADRVTMIKMDIEGAELESLQGARKTIRRDRPKLAVCIYHKPEDMIEIPLYIKELVPEYKLYIRHHSNSGTETVLYAVMP
ncbi:MAG: FkbM family methyltransferase [Oscillibacter sp.]|jgi:FkbM family methyltransferase|nr:FkbM family methyltransferase [Oscillibacter sp.]